MQGEYSVALPDGRLQTVSYTVLGDKGGFSANVHYSGKARHPPQNKKQFRSQLKSSSNRYPGPPSQARHGEVTGRSPQSVDYVPHKAFEK